ncbi:hypothetical protein BVC80_9003g25 [Macleaya cordata]|uniref:Uncharacterized protein n=1 Tax=Macleaya cordata TaxID=56857 RepID=A0A200QLU6_MACCD|nr:hypothetical protein BVC80_9003g25 [Macleaya cordata]
MVSSPARVSIRVIFVLLILAVAVYAGISQFVLEAQKSVGWYHDESDPGFEDVQSARKVGVMTTRRILRVVDSNEIR